MGSTIASSPAFETHEELLNAGQRLLNKYNLALLMPLFEDRMIRPQRCHHLKGEYIKESFIL
jgi:hypothetical protein